MEKQTFKQYLDSKQQLLKAIENTPVAVVEYEVKKYCALPLGEADDDPTVVDLRPKYKVIVEWRYDSITDPTPESIRVMGPSDVDQHERFQTFWTGSKLRKWLTRHAREGENNGHKTK